MSKANKADPIHPVSSCLVSMHREQSRTVHAPYINALHASGRGSFLTRATLHNPVQFHNNLTIRQIPVIL